MRTLPRLIRVACAVLATATFVAVAGCSGSTAKSSQGHVNLSFLGSDPPATVQPIIDAYQASHPSVTVKYVNKPFDDMNTTVQAQIGQGSSEPDVYMADYPRVTALAARGLLMRLDGVVSDVDKVFVRDAVRGSTYQGHLYALPGRTSTNILYYNTDLLAKAQQPAPSIDPKQRWTWEQVVAAGKAAQAAGAKWGVFFDQVSRYYQLQPLAESLGGGSGLSGDRNLTPALNNPAWQKATTFYRSLFDEGVAPRGIPVQQSPDLFTNGQVAFWVGGPWWLPKFAKSSNLKFGVAPFPYMAGGRPVTPTGSWAYGVNPHTKHKTAAIDFVKWLTADPTGNEVLFHGRFEPPANLQAATAYFAEVAKISPPGTPDLLKYEISTTGVARPRTIGWFQFEQIMNNMFEDVRNGQRADAAINAAEHKLTDAFSQLPTS